MAASSALLSAAQLSCAPSTAGFQFLIVVFLGGFGPAWIASTLRVNVISNFYPCPLCVEPDSNVLDMFRPAEMPKAVFATGTTMLLMYTFVGAFTYHYLGDDATFLEDWSSTHLKHAVRGGR